MPLPVDLPAARSVGGVRLATVAAGIKKNGKPDLVLIDLPDSACVAGVFTRNAFAAAPVQLCRRHLTASGGRVRALLINSGNANAGTGDAGLEMAEGHSTHVAERLNIPVEAVLPFSTGVIGEPLPDSLIRTGVDEAAPMLDGGLDAWQAAAAGIMTTDTQPKLTSRVLDTDAGAITVTGMAKGAGMIEPNMATMLAYVFTDAAVSQDVLQALLNDAVGGSFNAITVDGDTSTNDSVVLAAIGTGVSLDPSHPEWPAFSTAVHAVCLDLAQAIIRDAEGATRFVTVEVEAGRDRMECREVAYAIARSPLVKTAFFAGDANVGRLLMAIGKADVEALDASRVSVWLDDVCCFVSGTVSPSYTESAGTAVLARPEFTVRVRLDRGDAAATVYTSDLSHDYVSINADYRT